MEDRPATATELDHPRASLTRGVERFLAAIAHEHSRHLDAVAHAATVIPDAAGHLSNAAALQVRLTQQFLDAQRSLLRMWADVDAKVNGIVETAELEAAVLGLRIDGMIDASPTDETRAEVSLRSLLERWWDEARSNGSDALLSAREQAEQWVSVAHFAGSEAEPSERDVAERVELDPGPRSNHSVASANAEVVDGAPIAEPAEPLLPVPSVEFVARSSVPALPRDLAVTFETHAGRSLESLLDELDVVLSEPIALPQAAADTEIDLVPEHLPATVPGGDGFDQFWGTGAAGVGRPQRRLLGIVAPMLAVPVVLALVLVRIG